MAFPANYLLCGENRPELEATASVWDAVRLICPKQFFFYTVESENAQPCMPTFEAVEQQRQQEKNLVENTQPKKRHRQKPDMPATFLCAEQVNCFYCVMENLKTENMILQETPVMGNLNL